MKSLLRFIRSVQHSRISQLFWRLRLTARRKWLEKTSVKQRQRLNTTPIGALHISDDLPPPIFCPRIGKIRINSDELAVTFLNQTKVYQTKIDWHDPEFETGTRLWLLNLHYMEFLEELSTTDFELTVRDWIRNCPPFRSGYWKDDWNSYSISIRVVVWMQQFAERSHEFESDFQTLFLTSLKRQIRFLHRNLELDIGGNHLIKNIKALLWASAFFSGAEATQWQKTGLKLLRREIGEQVLSDGMHYERSPAYHVQVFSDLAEIYSLSKSGRIDLEGLSLLSVLEQMFQVLIDLTHPDGQISLFNDGGLDMTYSPKECAEVWLGLTGCVSEPRRNIRLINAGYLGIRDRDHFLLFDCGKIAPDHLPAHGHGDMLSFEWSINRERVILDFGVFEYNAGEMRQLSRCTKSHNTLTINDQDQCEFWSSFRVGRRASPRLEKLTTTENGIEFVASHDGYSNLPGRPIHVRTVDASNVSEFKVKDAVNGGNGQDVKSRLLINSDFNFEEGKHSIILTSQKSKVEIRTDLDYTIESSFWCPNFGVKQPATLITFHYGLAPCSGSYTIKKLV